MSKKELTFKGKVEPARAISLLNDLVAGMNSGGFYLQNGEEYIDLKPNQHLYMEVSASQKKGKDKIMIELSWEREEMNPKDINLSITTTPPPEPIKEKEEEVEVTVEKADTEKS